jgi:hypothetical protein
MTEVFLAQARDFAFWMLIGGALALSGMLGAGGSAVVARVRVLDAERRRIAGAALMLWLVSSALVLLAAYFLKPDALWALAAGCALALLRLALSLKFDLRAALPSGGDYAALLRAGFRPLIASVLYLPAAILGGTLTGAILYALLLLLAGVAFERGEAEKKRSAGHLTALALVMAVPLSFLPGRWNALAGLLIAWLTAVSLTAGPGSIFHLPSAFYEAWLPVRAWFIRRRVGR